MFNYKTPFMFYYLLIEFSPSTFTQYYKIKLKCFSSQLKNKVNNEVTLLLIATLIDQANIMNVGSKYL